MILWEDKEGLQKEVTRLQTSQFSDFYQKKFSTLTTDKPSLTDLPFLSREELVDTPPDKRLFVPANEVASIGYTSGSTSSTPLVSYFSTVDNYFFEPSLGTGIQRPLIVYPPLNKNFSYSFVQQCRQAHNPVTPIFGDYQNLPNSAVIAKTTTVDAIYATPTLAENLHGHIAKHYDPQKIQLLALSSETLTKTKRAILKEHYPEADIANLYASSEIGQFILFPCPHIIKEGREEFHFLSNALLGLELIKNELVVTYALNKAFPLIRYQTGDFLEVAQKSCQCGLPGATLKWRGREDVDRIRAHGFEIHLEDIDHFFSTVPVRVGDDYQIHFYDDATDPKQIRIEIEVIDKKNDRGQQEVLGRLLQDTFVDTFMLSPHMSISQAIEKHIISAVSVVFVDTFSQTTEKNRKIVNHLA
ncbi:hypothetical protein ACFL6I_18150 [candidate division KSB1 bacterium]